MRTIVKKLAWCILLLFPIVPIKAEYVDNNKAGLVGQKRNSSIRLNKHRYLQLLNMRTKIMIVVILMSNTAFSQHNEIVTYIQSNNSITANFTLPSYQIIDTNTYDTYGINQYYKYIKIDDFGILDDIGFPELPQYSIDFAIPENASNITVTSSNLYYNSITLDRRIYPSQDDPEIGQSFTIDNNYYSTTGIQYSFKHQLSVPFSIFNQKGITLSILPFIYNPSINKLTVLKSGTFTITYSTLKSTTVNEYTSNSREEYLSQLFCNYSRTKSGAVHIGRYLIITPQAYENTLTYFANYKRNIGYAVTVVNTLTTGTTNTDIKNYIQNSYNNAGTRPDFVLLVGDINHIPASGGTQGDYEDPLTDLNYSLLSGDDYFADVFLGRWSVASTAQLQRIINKTIYMESNLHKMQKRAVFLSGGGGGENQFANTQQWVMDNTFEPEGWVCDSYFAVDGATRIDGLNALNNNYLFFIYRGHGYAPPSTGWPIPFKIINRDIDRSTNTLYPMGFSFSCFTNNFGALDYSGLTMTCFGEQWIRSERGGVSFFGATTDTYRHTNNVIEKKIFGEAFADEEQLAAMINLGMKRYWNRFWSWSNRIRTKRHMKSYNLLGDPSFNKSGNGCIQNFIFNQNETFNSGDSLTYHACNNIENTSSFVLNSDSRVSLIAGNSITLNPGFRAEAGSDFRAFIASCTNSTTLKSAKISNNQIETSLFLDSIKTAPLNLELTAYPNPFRDILTLRFKVKEKEEVVSLTISNQFGVVLMKPIDSKLYSEGIHYENISSADMPCGMYFYKIKIGEHQFSGKVLKID